MSTIKDLNLAPSGERKIRWVEAHMPVLRRDAAAGGIIAHLSLIHI